MKKLILSVTMLAIATSTIFVACKKGEEKKETNVSLGKSNSKSNSRLTNDLNVYLQSIDNVGIMHNECMDYLFDYTVALKANNWTGTTNQLLDSFKVKVLSFYASKGINGTPYIDLNYQTQIPTTLSTNAQQILNTVYNAINAYGANQISHAQLLNICVSQKSIAFQLADENESYIVGTGCAVAQYSMTYWKENAAKYDQFVNNPTNFDPCAMSDNQKEVGKADVGGAVGGAIGGVAGGPAGIITGAATGAAYASFKKATEKVLGWDLWWLP
jgi:hypothetical protein